MGSEKGCAFRAGSWQCRLDRGNMCSLRAKPSMGFPAFKQGLMASKLVAFSNSLWHGGMTRRALVAALVAARAGTTGRSGFFESAPLYGAVRRLSPFQAHASGRIGSVRPVIFG